MSGKDSPQEIIDSYQKNQRIAPFIFGAIAIIMVVVGVIVLIVWLAGPDKSTALAKETETPLPTSTITNTSIPPTATETLTPTLTATATATITETPSGPFEYIVQDGDNCWGIATQFEIEFEVLLAINNFGGDCPIQPGDTILIPAPGQTLPTETPLPPDLAYGTKIEYTIKTGDSLDTIAAAFNTTVESILEENEDLDDANTIYAGQKIIIKVNIVTPTNTPLPVTDTPEFTATP